MDFAKIKLKTDGALTTIIIDGVDISDKVSCVTFRHEGGEYPVLCVECPVDSATIKGMSTYAEKRPPSRWRRMLRFLRGDKEWTL